MKRITVIILAFLFLAPLSLPKEREYFFDEQAAMGYLKVLASDSMEGRESGQPGGVKAEEYIAAKFREWGLKPAGDNGTFFQNITLEHRHVEEGIILEIVADRPLFLYSPLIEGEYRAVQGGKNFLFGVDLS